MESVSIAENLPVNFQTAVKIDLIKICSFRQGLSPGTILVFYFGKSILEISEWIGFHVLQESFLPAYISLEQGFIFPGLRKIEVNELKKGFKIFYTASSLQLRLPIH